MATKTVLQTGIALLGIEDPVMMYVAKSDTETNDGMGSFMLTNDPKDALHFDTMQDALECWRRQSIVKPTREDGKPNRPLTALTVSFCNIEVEDA